MLRIGFFQVWVDLYFMKNFPNIWASKASNNLGIGTQTQKNVQEHFNNLLYVVGLRLHIELNS
jgi:hypothetical protein